MHVVLCDACCVNEQKQCAVTFLSKVVKLRGQTSRYRTALFACSKIACHTTLLTREELSIDIRYVSDPTIDLALIRPCV